MTFRAKEEQENYLKEKAKSLGISVNALLVMKVWEMIEQDKQEKEKNNEVNKWIKRSNKSLFAVKKRLCNETADMHSVRNQIR